jgi:hypothetical protein
MGHEKHSVAVFGEGLRALSVRMLPRSTEQGEALKRLPGGAPAGEMFTGVRGPAFWPRTSRCRLGAEMNRLQFSEDLTRDLRQLAMAEV